ncbi:hypothetical protein [Acinetobacter sp. Marseille-Q1618]|uniref:hypothetical protein n=1 Tax=Acinetobacter sp. Marseille-Q1618 TaxID=2697502 RepID=UPI0015712DF7|nr:hypothetical protein [Acinetobacter sp. Marseille-Q1618]
MSLKNDYPVQSADLKTGLMRLKQRQSKLTAFTVLSCVVFITTALSLFIQQDVVFHFLGLTQNISQLHIPLSVDQNLQAYVDQPNYLMNLFSWFGWLLLKVVVSFIGAFFIVSFLKKFRFFLVRFQSFVLKFVAWLIAFAVLWAGLTYVQYDWKDNEQSVYEKLVHYDRNIQQSHIFQYLRQSETAQPVQAYLLGQAALLHKPQDQEVATAYVAQLVQAERTDPHFFEYGFKSEQLWAMQHAVYGKSVTASTEKLQPRIENAQYWSAMIQKVLLGISILFLVLSLILYALTQRFKQRVIRIQRQIYLE